jgi:hypothetical protein
MFMVYQGQVADRWWVIVNIEASSLNAPYLCIEKLRMISKLTNAHKCMKVYYTHPIRPTGFGHSCGHFQGAALQRIDASKHYRSFWNQCTDIKY